MEKIAEVRGVMGATLQLVKDGDQLFMVDGEKRYPVHQPLGVDLLKLQIDCSFTFNSRFSVRTDDMLKEGMLDLKKLQVIPQAPFYDLKKMTGMDIVEDEKRGITRGGGGMGWTRSKD